MTYASSSGERDFLASVGSPTEKQKDRVLREAGICPDSDKIELIGKYNEILDGVPQNPTTGLVVEDVRGALERMYRSRDSTLKEKPAIRVGDAEEARSQIALLKAMSEGRYVSAYDYCLMRRGEADPDSPENKAKCAADQNLRRIYQERFLQASRAANFAKRQMDAAA